MTNQSANPEKVHLRPIRTFVLRQTRMTLLQKNSYEKFMPNFGVHFGKNSWEDLGFDNEKPIVLEIGFGMGHATAAIAKMNPDVQYFGVEVHTPGVGALLARMDEQNLTNIRVMQHDAVEVLKSFIPPNSLTGVHLFFADPWPKKKHHKRRMYQPWFLDLVHKVLKPDGYLYSVTDWEDYAQQMLRVAGDHSGFHNPNKDFSPPISWRPKTAFEYKGLEKQHNIREMYILKC